MRIATPIITLGFAVTAFGQESIQQLAASGDIAPDTGGAIIEGVGSPSVVPHGGVVIGFPLMGPGVTPSDDFAQYVLRDGVFGTAFGATLGDPNYDPAVDFNADGMIDIIGFGLFGTEFGSTAAECQVMF